MSMFFAYIDPFTGMLALQLLSMAFLATMVFLWKVKTFILGLFGIKPAVKADEQADAEPQDVQTIKLEESDKGGKKAA